MIFIKNNIYTLKRMERVDMNNDTQQNQENEESELQYYKRILHAQIDDMNDLDILKSITAFIFKVSFWRKD